MTLKFGQKLIAFIVTNLILVLGFVAVIKFAASAESFDILGKWIIIAFGIFAESNVVNTLFFKKEK